MFMEIDWIEVAQTIGIITAIMISVWQIRVMIKHNKLQIQQQMILSHRDYWKLMYQYPELARITEKNINLDEKPLTIFEERYVHMLINHLTFVISASKEKSYEILEGDKLDIKTFFELPIPKKVWNESKKYHSKDFVKKFEDIINSKSD